jgi:YVTN family beta-propeller protein
MLESLKRLTKYLTGLDNAGFVVSILASTAGTLLLLGTPHAASGAELPGVDAPAAVFNHPTYSSPIAISNDDRLVWVVNSRDDTVSILRTDNNSVLRTIPVGDEPRSVAVDPNNKFAFVSNAAGSWVT